ncbi:DUF1015 family protein [Nonomuraea sp. NPDC003214]
MPGMGNSELPIPDGLELRPFRGVRFAVDDPAKVTSPPYDLISDGDVHALLDSHPYNVVRLILPISPPGDANQPAPADHSGESTPASGTPANPGTPPAHSQPHSHAPSKPTPTPGGSAAAPPSGRPAAAPQPGGPAAEPPSGRPATAERHGRAAATPEAGSSEAPPARYGQARDTLQAWLASGVLVVDDRPALYLYEQRGEHVVQRGLIGDVCLADPAQGIVLPHEDVMPGPIADRLALMSTTQANLEPIFLLYDGATGTATTLVDEVAATRPPLVTAHTEDGLTHRLWAITDEAEIDAVNADLHARQALIADGHHRYATYRVLQRQEHATRPQPAGSQVPSSGASPLSRRAGGGPWDFGLALLVDSRAYPPDLKAIHRVIPGLPLPEAAARAKGAWRVQDQRDLAEGMAALDAAENPAFLLAGAEGVHLLTHPDPVQLALAMPADRSDRWNSLNTSILTQFVLPKVWGLQDDEKTVRIVHHDPYAALRLAVETGGTAVLLKPLAVDDVLAVAAGGERVPRKSTSFGPKPRTGLVLRTFAID